MFTPADFGALPARDLRGTDCVVFDVLRATSSMVAALAAGAESIIPVPDIPDALELRRQRPEVLLAGERHSVRIGAELTGGIEFDLGNSPSEYTADRVGGRTVVMTTTNGTRALRACSGGRTVLACSFLNLQATRQWLQAQRPADWLLVGSGTFEEAALEDILAAGALADEVWSRFGADAVSDGAVMARELYCRHAADLPAALGSARNGRRLLAQPDLRDDVAFCLQRDTAPVVARLDPDGALRRVR